MSDLPSDDFKNTITHSFDMPTLIFRYCGANSVRLLGCEMLLLSGTEKAFVEIDSSGTKVHCWQLISRQFGAEPNEDSMPPNMYTSYMEARQNCMLPCSPDGGRSIWLRTSIDLPVGHFAQPYFVDCDGQIVVSDVKFVRDFSNGLPNVPCWLSFTLRMEPNCCGEGQGRGTRREHSRNSLNERDGGGPSSGSRGGTYHSGGQHQQRGGGRGRDCGAHCDSYPSGRRGVPPSNNSNFRGNNDAYQHHRHDCENNAEERHVSHATFTTDPLWLSKPFEKMQWNEKIYSQVCMILGMMYDS